MSRILVTGGAGFIGSYVNALLQRQGHDTVVYDNLSRGCREMVNEGQLVVGDLRDRERLSALLEEKAFDGIMHFAAAIDAGESVRQPLMYYDNNVAATLSLLDTMREHGPDVLIFSSTAAVYGEPQAERIDEMHPCKPINPYGRSKLMVEEILRDIEQAYGVRSICLRYFNAAGGDPQKQLRNRKPQEHNLIPICLRNTLATQAVTVFGTDYPTPDGTCIRDYIHVHDLATAHIAALETLLQGGASATLNLGTGRGYSVREVIDAVRETTKRPLSIVEGARRAGDPVHLIADAAKACQTLRWTPEYTDLHTIVEHAWQGLQR